MIIMDWAGIEETDLFRVSRSSQNVRTTCNRRRLIDTGIYTYRNSDHCKAYRKWEKIPYGCWQMKQDFMLY